MFSGRIHAAMLDNAFNNKKPFRNHYFMNTGHGEGEGVKPLNFRPPITGNLTYKPAVEDRLARPRPAVMPSYSSRLNVGLPGNQVGLNVVTPFSPNVYRPGFYDTYNTTSAIVGNPNMRQFLAEQLGKKTTVGNEGVSEQGRSPM